jgi:hypothetical protein
MILDENLRPTARWKSSNRFDPCKVTVESGRHILHTTPFMMDGDRKIGPLKVFSKENLLFYHALYLEKEIEGFSRK